MANDTHDEQKSLKGSGVSEGIAIGKAIIIERERISIPHRMIGTAEAGEEVARLRESLEKAKQGLLAIKQGLSSAASHEPAFIIDAHLMMLEDDMLVEGAIAIIRERGINAEWALRIKVAELVAVFSRMSDPYLRERGRDVEEVAERVVRELVGKKDSPLARIDEPVIVVAHELSPAETAHMAVDRVLGFATDIGSQTSHAAIVAKSLRIPAVVGLKTITASAAHGDTILIDGQAGIVILNPSTQTVRDYEDKRKRIAEMRVALQEYRGLESETLDHAKIKLAANLEIMEEIAFYEESGAEGVGLYRTEYLYLDRDDLPSEDEHFEGYKKLARASGAHGATIRTLDLGGDKFKSTLSLSDELNPAMGLRAIRLCLNRPDLFKTQLRAILRASAFGKARIMFPMISGFQEFRDAKRLLHEAAAELDKEGVAFDRALELGIMIEVPSAAFIAAELAEAADFFSIGTNDLIQYTLAIDRINENVSYLYQPLHPAILRIVSAVVKAGHEKGIPVHMCGAMAAEPAYLPVLIGLGLDELSMPMANVLRIRKVMRGIRKAEAEELVRELFTYKTAQEIKERVKREIRSRWAEAYALEREVFEDEDLPPVG
ncbi:MAG TPA: phosphoenolpyruvate--protein phosphotransferase [bacterium]|nr:phosphoenolpyruvate--protein phosphotransferase [bacterium]